MFFEGGGYKLRAGCHGARTVIHFVCVKNKHLLFKHPVLGYLAKLGATEQQVDI